MEVFFLSAIIGGRARSLLAALHATLTNRPSSRTYVTIAQLGVVFKRLITVITDPTLIENGRRASACQGTQAMIKSFSSTF